MADPYDFNAPQYFDFIQDVSSKEQAQEGGGGGGGDAASQPAVKSDDPWEFDAPTWSDLNSTSTTTAQALPPAPVAAAAAVVAHPPTPPKTASSSLPRRSVGSTEKPKAPSNLVKSMKPQSPSAAAAAATSARTSPASSRLRSTSRIPSPNQKAAATTTKASSSSAAAGATAGATTKTATTTTPRTFTNRIRKTQDTAPSAPVQHSFLSHTAATARKRTAVNDMASFLRPTAASWGRNQKEGPNAGTAGANRRTGGPSAMRGGNAATSTTSRSGPVRAVGKMTTTKTRSGVMAPTGHQRGGKLETTEERELRLAAEAKERFRKQRLANLAACERNRVVGSTVTAPLRSTKALTIPHSPHLHLSHRHGDKMMMMAGGGRDLEAEVFSKASMKPPSPRGPRPLTVPVGPALHTDSRAQARAPAKVETENVPPPPPRRKIHHNHDGGDAGHQYAVKPPSPRLTVPHTPNLTTKKRAQARQTAQPVKTTMHEVDDRDAEEMKHQFKARPLDRRILQSTGEMGVPKVTKNEVTHPEPFHFATDSRIRRPTSADQEGEAFEDKGMHREDHHRHQAYHHHSGKPELVVPHPFQLETEKRGQLHKMLFEAKLAQEKEAELMAHEVHANPVPNFHHAFMPHPSEKELTEFDTFHLESVRRHDEYQQAYLEEVRLKREQELRAANVRALPLPMSTYQKTFEVKPSDREPLIPVSMNLSSSIRAEERKAFEAELKARAEQQKAEEEAAAEEAKRAQEEELRRLRNTPMEEGGMQFVAKAPLVVHRPLMPGPSARKLTVPVSPNLQTKSRAYVRPQSSLRPPGQH